MNLAPLRSSLVRVLEPEVMDSTDEARDYDAMDHGEVNRRFVGDLLAAQMQFSVPTNARVLDLGTGTAQIPIELCERNPLASVVAIDLAESMLQLAAENVERRGLTARIALQKIDAKGLPFADGQFAVVMSNSIVHHIPEPQSALAEAVRVLSKPGGLIFVRDLARPVDEKQVLKLVETYAAGCNDHQWSLFDASLRAALSVEEIRALVISLGFDPSTVQATSDRHWTWCAVRD
jgi:ubiquinone/menaquinone biosynthesis C-methylase UbiE